MPLMIKRPIRTRPMEPLDVPKVHDLLIQLGYDASDETVRERFELMTGSSDHLLAVAELDDDVIGLIHAFVRIALEKPVETVVQSLVVDTRVRRSGAGQLLMEVVETWTKGKGLVSISLSSQISRKEAHRFYESLGYDRTATSYFMRR